MSDSRSAPLKAAWERARRYAAEHGVSVRRARSILAKLPAESKPKTAKPSSKPKPQSASKPGKYDSPDLAAAEKLLRAKYPQVIAGTLRAHSSGAHAGRRTVEIQCKTAGCKHRRVVHTSDLFQVSRCIECARAHRSQMRSQAKKKGKR